jgi:hypothetical protein
MEQEKIIIDPEKVIKVEPKQIEDGMSVSFKLTKKTKILGILNIVYLCVIAIEEAKIIEMFPFEDTIKTTIKGVIFALVTILNVVIAQLKIK